MSHRAPPKVNLYEDPEISLRRLVDAGLTDGPTAEIPVEVFFELDRTTQWIRANSYKRVALQFPDHLLRHAPSVCSEIQKRCTVLPNHIVSTFVLGDTSYGQCCVDEVAAEHIDADSIIHYGPACLSATRRLPVFYVFGRKLLDVNDLLAKLSSELNPTDHILFMYDVIYQHTMEDLERILRLEKGFVNAIVAKVNPLFDKLRGGASESDGVAIDTNKSHNEEFCGRSFRRHAGVSMEQYNIVYIGSEGRTLTNLIMTFNQCKLYTYNPDSLEFRRETISANKMLMKRFYLIEKSKDADIIGILVGTLSVSKYLDMIDHLKDIITKAGKRYYMFVVGKLNVPKLANFQEIEMFVIVACPENSLIDSKDLYIPVVTPHELEIALVRFVSASELLESRRDNGKEWTNSYSTDFQKVLAEASTVPEIEPTYDFNEESSETRVSLISNKVKVNHKVLSSSAANSNSMDLTLRNSNNELVTTSQPSATSFFLQRSYQGLQQQLGETPVEMATEGRGGVPLQYEGEIPDGE